METKTITVNDEKEKLTVGRPVPINELVKPWTRQVLFQWLKILKGIPEGQAQRVKKNPRKAIKSLVKRGMLADEYIVVEKGRGAWRRGVGERQLWVVHLPRDAEERDRLLRDFGRRKSRK